MALDNILALFMLPLFGYISDKTGKRMPFIIFGTAAAVILTVMIPFADRHGSLLFFFVALGLLLIAMGTYRSPAVALMPDVTPKPLRSKANAIINLMGAFGGIYTLGVLKLLGKEPADGSGVNYVLIFGLIVAVMVIAVVLLAAFVRERKLRREMEEINYGVAPEEDQAAKVTEAGSEKLRPEVMRSLVFILVSVSLWFLGYNAVTTAFTKYATQQWGQDVSGASTCLLVATAGAIVSYIPVGMLSSKFGRKRVIQFGIILLASCFGIGALVSTSFHPALYVMFALVGFAWACINVNSYPMVVEISRGSSIGKYTGYYYTFSMAAQIVTPIVSGALLEHVGYWTLFPYSAVMVALAFFTISMTRHGDNKPNKAASRLEAYDTQD
jgi:MFS family permease